jgi:ribonuclease HI/transposase InsO family protein
LYALLITKRKLLHYFQAFKITVVCDVPLGDILHNRDASGRIMKYALELSEFTLQFRSRRTIKSQVLPDFIAEWSDICLPLADSVTEHWQMYFDGSLKIDGAGAGVYFISPSKDTIKYVLRIHFRASNNVAEYEAALHGLRIAVELGIKRLLVYGDSALVINQVNKEWDTVHEKMDAYVAAIRKLEIKFYGLEFIHIPRAQNVGADELSKLGSTRAKLPPGVFVQDLLKPSISDQADQTTKPDATASDLVALLSNNTKDNESPGQQEADEGTELPEQVVPPQPDWREPFIKYLNEHLVPEDKIAAQQLVRRAKLYAMVNGELMRKGPRSIIYQKCITQKEGLELLKEIHEGMCGNHAASRTLVGKAYRAGFYWPTAVTDAEDYVRRCANCQMFAKQIHVPAHDLQTIPVAWPFSCWGLDMIGPFKKAPGGYASVYVLIDKFSKWIEYKPVKQATAEKAVQFLDEVIHRFGIPNSIITDLGSQFTSDAFFNFCEDNCIKVKYVSIAHPRANGQVERANGMILDALKKRVYQADKVLKPGRWLQELPAVVWGLRTQPSRNTGVSPYFMVYGSEAVLPAEVAFRSPRVAYYNEDVSNSARDVDIIAKEEQALDSCVRTAKYLAAVRRYYNRNVRGRLFVVGDLVLRRIQKTDGLHKLSPRWEGPFRVKAVTRPTSYRLETLEGVEEPNSWHIELLIRYHV